MMEETYQPYPKMLYLHPEDKTKEHTYIVVNNEEEKDAALAKGYVIEPHNPVTGDELPTEAVVATNEEAV